MLLEQFEMPDYNRADELKAFNYLKENIYNGLDFLNNGFDAKSIYYFNESDFEIVLDRVESLGIEPWLNGDFYDVRVVEDYKISDISKWHRKVFSEFKNKGENLQYAASYKIPKELLND